ncbi:hypothetical protein V6Z12_A01G075800 [Gossypium hirsutum]
MYVQLPSPFLHGTVLFNRLFKPSFSHSLLQRQPLIPLKCTAPKIKILGFIFTAMEPPFYLVAIDA